MAAKLAPRQPLIGLAILAVITLLGFGSPFLPPEFLGNLSPWFDSVRASPWAPFAAIFGYTLLASLGTPQIVLITAIVAAFGPWFGLLYSWTGKLLACCLGFAVGRAYGARLIARHANARLTEIMEQLARRGFLFSALIRMVPTVPSVLVNIAAGATPIRFWDFFFGTALGSVPKMALLAFGGHAAMVAVRNNSGWAWLALGLALVLWVALTLAARNWMKPRTDRGQAGPTE